ncbi:hypothetical protein VR611_07905 [Aquirufa nivalisilvae]
MPIHIIPDNEGKGFTQIGYINDFEYLNPIEQVRVMSIESRIALERTILSYNKPPLPINNFDDILYKRAEKFWQERYIEIMETKYSENFDKLLECNKKQQQINLLKNQKISSLGLIAFIFNAFQKYGFIYSQYKAEHKHNGLDETKLPTLIHLKEGKIFVSGKTVLTVGQLKQVVEQRKVIISKFIDNEDKWHCFFITFQSLKGEENWKNGTPHFHYISNTFGLTREQVLTELKSKNYKLNNLPHIELTDYEK